MARGMNVRRMVNGSGAVRWEARWRDDSGKERSASYATEEQALAAQAERRLRRSRGVVDEDQPFARYVDGWLAEKQLSGTKAKTLSGYHDLARLHVLPALGHVPVGRVTTPVLQDFVNTLARTTLPSTGHTPAPSSIKAVFGVVRMVCKYAIRQQALTNDPTTAVELPKVTTNPKPKFQAHRLSDEQLDKLYAALDERDPTGLDSLVVRVLASTGLRSAECSGLEVGDVDVEARTLRIIRTKTVCGTKVEHGTPKTDRSTRTIRLGHTATAFLADHLALHPHADDPTAPLFPARVRATKVGERSTTVDYSRPIDTNSFLRCRFRPALVAAKLPEATRLHDLRHSTATRLIAKGAPLHKVSQILGHANTSTTESIYVTPDPSQYDDLELLD